MPGGIIRYKPEIMLWPLLYALFTWGTVRSALSSVQVNDPATCVFALQTLAAVSTAERKNILTGTPFVHDYY